MRTLLRRTQAWRARMLRAGTSFCDACSEVCTASCRRDALLRRTYQSVQRSLPVSR